MTHGQFSASEFLGQKGNGFCQPGAVGQESRGLEERAFDPTIFRRLAETATAKLECYLHDDSIRGLDLTDPAALSRVARELASRDPEGGGPSDEKRLEAILDLYLATGIRVYSPGYMGRQFSGVVPLAGVVDFVSSIVNQPSAFYEAGQLPNVAERILAEEFGRLIGWAPGRFEMVTTSGGSLANLTALLTARNDRFPHFWTQGAAGAGETRPALAVGEDAHYCVRRAAGVLGIGEEQIVRLPTNGRGQICPARAASTLDAAAERGLNVFCLVASAGTTAVGACDPLDELADIAATRGLWLHVDGAHGASLLVSDELRHKLRGLDRADSFAWDAHKLMFVPGVCTLLFYKHKEKARKAFRQEASYVFDAASSIYTALDTAEMTVECTKRPLIMPLWVVWAMYGRELFACKIEYLCRLTRAAHAVIERERDFETVHEPEMNILCFRFRPPGDPNSSDLQVAIRDRVRKRGAFFISKVDVGGAAALRVVFMNHRIELSHFILLLEEIRAVANELRAESE